MIGGGFIGQMNETMKKNRDMVRASLGKVKRQAFDNGQYGSTNKNKLPDTEVSLTDSQRNELIANVKRAQQQEALRKILILIISISIVIIISLVLKN